MPRPVSPVARTAAAVAALLGTASAGMSAFWLLGGTALLDTVGGQIERWGRERSPGVLVALAVVVVLKLVGAAAPVVLVGVGRAHLPVWTAGRWPRLLGWFAAAGLALYGGVLGVVGLLVEAGAIDTPAGADRHALAWHANLWDPWFALWGLAWMVAMWCSRQRSTAGS